MLDWASGWASKGKVGMGLGSFYFGLGLVLGFSKYIGSGCFILCTRTKVVNW